MAKAPKSKPTPLEQMPGPGACAVPEGYAFVPKTGGAGLYYFDGFNVSILPFPENPSGQRLIITTAGLAWENV